MKYYRKSGGFFSQIFLFCFLLFVTILSAYYWISGKFLVREFLILIIFLVALSLLIFASFFYNSYRNLRRRHKRDLIRVYSEVNSVLVAFQELFEARIIVSEDLFSAIAKPDSTTENFESIPNFMQVAVDKLQETISGMQNRNCAVSIKVIVSDDENTDNPYVHTFVRDSKNYDRYKTDERTDKYSLSAHSPFRDIISGVEKNGVFVEQDIRQVESYANARTDWEKDYTSLLVVPIYNTNFDIREDIVGFLCVDGHDIDFKSTNSTKLTKIFAMSIYHVLYTYRRIEDMHADLGFKNDN